MGKEDFCPMCGSPVIIETSGETLYPDFCRTCAAKIMGYWNKKDERTLKKFKKKAKKNAGRL